ncbi:bifunctional 3-(3-hydroxy-phenyl)propionate/3-hydroxycinnamic acid hydroxylase [Pseudooceanicola spongiae]|uniref:Bifunctional 3-(3-hydroxy-phenyl)propionate/3-hydroxycinnamic acid hydroxylase n=1 Tax=Pseudooceanicola spongiae TaxID=2613965 RepID=A0A7L9WRR4_9RHOB|nr:bifunctional 3-(3-hydroxy-phenyl)propionate/3-hydroxycinnamic acid hydroxylase [Pseudooceanicola spongiae]QOL83011.1 bifunctional 3-(3-hydroxy-phenyl)propionate/3-hydroxycinnamic acid hydroxylase [Pseudooceanicola spongiae]
MTGPTLFDVAIVGFGPSGAVAAAQLGQTGCSVVVLERGDKVYELPRAIALDHEILRHLDGLGLHDTVMPYIEPFTDSEHFGAQGQLIRRISMVPAPYPQGYTPNMVFSQPPVEAAMRDLAAGLGTVDVRLNHQVMALAESEDRVRLTVRDAAGMQSDIEARYVIGCDGASSTVRQLAGIRLDDLIFDEPWLVVDVLVNEDKLDLVPACSAQFCEPERPISYIIGPKTHRRWEIMLTPGEDPMQMQTPESVWNILSRWITPEDGTLWRAACYRFHALVADRWRVGRIFVAGDAAHQQPPFIGQGMCQGVRDVTNLAWKLSEVLKGQSDHRLLDTYETERKAHVTALTGRIKAIGEAICIQDVERAAARDAEILAKGGGKPLEVTRQDIVPPLTQGLIDRSAAAGTLAPQPWVRQGDDFELLDRVIGHGWRLILDGRKITIADLKDHPDAARLTLAQIGGTGGLEERDAVMSGWFDATGSIACLIRPDHYVYGTALSLLDLAALLAGARAYKTN